MRAERWIQRWCSWLIAGVLVVWSVPAISGPIFLTGHDPDFHSQDSPGAAVLLRTALNFVTGGTYNDGNIPATRFLWVESRPGSVPGGHRIGEAGLNTLGLVLNTDYDRANGSEFAGVNFSNYTAIVIASSFGGLLSSAELTALNARSSDIAAFVNAGGGLFAAAECYPCGANLLGSATGLFGFVPLSGIVPLGTSGPYTVTAAGAAAPFNLVNGDVNDPTHNAFDITKVPSALTVLDTQPDGNAVTLAGITTINDGGFGSVPEPASVVLLGVGLAGLAFSRRRILR